ncbi:hypothetical protein [Heterosigma akashiwo virus 01]|uniref:Uncharacterized protein n=1 Tax=Heterosigma akashiwo virus 01 TaxID=97195 RepID=A0A1C9C4Y9_HAV01|nr:hypothetical protein D1R72_gp027 [Heterosigma akashiwo virus 01]AOM63358.1 hypothetical protein [Heterosigma akashiwo virus 01]
MFVRIVFLKSLLILYSNILMDSLDIRDPSNFTFTEDEQKEIDKKLNEAIPELSNKNVNLETDHIKIDGQNFALISIVAPEGLNQKSNKVCIKIKGVFDTVENARQHANDLTKHDPTFDVFVVSLYEWLLVPPDMDKISEQEYVDEELNTIITEFKKSQKQVQLEFETRKDALRSNIDINTTIINDEDMNVKMLPNEELGDDSDGGVEETKGEKHVSFSNDIGTLLEKMNGTDSWCKDEDDDDDDNDDDDDIKELKNDLKIV